jgi:hypothetical protein
MRFTPAGLTTEGRGGSGTNDMFSLGDEGVKGTQNRVEGWQGERFRR